MKIRAKLFRWRDEQWKERGIGNAKLMRDRAIDFADLVGRADELVALGGGVLGDHRGQLGAQRLVVGREPLIVAVAEFDPPVVVFCRAVRLRAWIRPLSAATGEIRSGRDFVGLGECTLVARWECHCRRT